MAELKLLGLNRSLLVYHHQTRRPGGHREEIVWQAKRLEEVGFSKIDALRAHRYSARVFFLLNGSQSIRERAAKFANRWSEHVEWLPQLDARC
jgi:hypothetical protein